MNKIYMLNKRSRGNRSPYMTVLPLNMGRVRQSYADMRKSGVNDFNARLVVYRLLSTGRTSRSSTEIENETRDERLLKAF